MPRQYLPAFFCTRCNAFCTSINSLQLGPVFILLLLLLTLPEFLRNFTSVNSQTFLKNCLHSKNLAGRVIIEHSHHRQFLTPVPVQKRNIYRFCKSSLFFFL